MRHSIRIQHIDVLRAIAILLMFYAHLVPHYVDIGEEVHFFERLLSSLAAPIFLFLVGYNFSPSISLKKQMKRVIVILIYACLIDMFIWGIYPFYSFDVLYTIGLSLVFLQLISRGTIAFKIALLLILLVIMLLIWKFNFYELSLDEPYLGESYNAFNVLFNLVINGWFPLLPWLIFPLLGYLAKDINFNHKIVGVSGGITFLIMLYLFQNTVFGTRPFAVEIFYPAGLVYLLISISWLAILWSTKGFFDNSVFKFLNPLGKGSFFLYGLHLLCYHLFADQLIKLGLHKWQLFLLFILVFYFISLMLESLKTKWPSYANYQILKVIFGG